MPTGKPFIIAEAGVNHNGDDALAVKLVDAAADAGADAVKFQTFRADSLASADAPKAAYQQERAGGESQREMLKKLELSEKGHRDALARARARGVVFLSTPFDEESADFLDSLDIPRFKLPSGEVTNLPFLRHVAKKGRPVILSTGMSTLEEVRAAVETLRASGCRDLTLLHCVSSYPADSADSNLKAMLTLAETFRVPAGWSDHTTGTTTAIAAVALGAAVLEKHFTLDKTLPGPDHAMSLNPAELKAYCAVARETAAALGDGIKAPRPVERPIALVARKSLVLRKAMPQGTVLRSDDLTAKRPGTGISPALLDQLVGKRLKIDTPADRPLSWEDFN